MVQSGTTPGDEPPVAVGADANTDANTDAADGRNRNAKTIRAGLRGLGRLTAIFILLANALSLLGFFARDRSLALALCLYLPLLPFGLAAIFSGLLFRKTLPRPVVSALLVIGTASAGIDLWWMTGLGVTATVPPETAHLSILHWNVCWGGISTDGKPAWPRIAAEIIAANPDVTVLSEAPRNVKSLDDFNQMPGAPKGLLIALPGNGLHEFRVYVLARWPLRFDGFVPITNGSAASVWVDHPSRPLRMLIVDGESRISHIRTPMLRDIAMACETAAVHGEPFDLVLGDFNSVSRSIGFDRISQPQGNYQLASRACVGWRGTWPSFFPVLDIDHIWARSEWPILGCRVFTNRASDHRGQVVELGVPPRPRMLTQTTNTDTNRWPPRQGTSVMLD